MPRVWLQRGCIIGGSSSSCMGEAGALAGVLAARLHRDWRRRGPRPGPFACANCCGVLQRPVTAACGHTCCRTCVRARCPECGVRAHHQQHNATNVLVQGLVERLWRDQLSAARRAHDAERLLACRADPDKALATCNDALHYCEYFLFSLRFFSFVACVHMFLCMFRSIWKNGRGFQNTFIRIEFGHYVMSFRHLGFVLKFKTADGNLYPFRAALHQLDPASRRNRFM